MVAVASPSKWAQDQVATLPEKWRGRIVAQWRATARPRLTKYIYGQRPTWYETCEGDQRTANLQLREVAGNLKSSRLTLDAGDDEIRERAEYLASECRVEVIEFANSGAMDAGGEGWEMPLAVGLRAIAMREGVAVPWDARKDKRMKWPGVARMMCGQWWRRQLRAAHAKAVEGSAIGLGFVNRARECYVSDESLHRRQQQNKRNADMLARTVLENDEGDQFTLAELSARSTANKAIRRGELMTRIAGCERIAQDLWHGGIFITQTCPSRMHKWATVRGTNKVYPNPKYDGTLPPEAQKYLCKVWARQRAALHREGIKPYGFRIAEPNHDGTPHWHLLLFVEPEKIGRMIEIMRDHALRDSPDEAGAAGHRIKSVVIDWNKGSAAGYIAKYVAKNIDGMYVEKDLLGNDAMHTSARVEAWAATWGIRQFQQIGGAPVTVWRELRRVKELPEGAPEHLRKAWQAANKTEEKKADFGAYIEAQGGPLVGRDYKIRRRMEDRAGEGVYGDALAPVAVGVETVGKKRYMIGLLEAVNGTFRWLVDSVRRVWRVVKSGVKNGERFGGGFPGAIAAGVRAGVSGSASLFVDRAGIRGTGGAGGNEAGIWGSVLGPLAAPWTRVNNCTHPRGLTPEELDYRRGAGGVFAVPWG